MKHFSHIWRLLQWVGCLIMTSYGLHRLGNENYSLTLVLGGGFAFIALWLWDIEQRIKDLQNKS